MVPGLEPADPQPSAPEQPEQTGGADFTALQEQLTSLAPSLDALRSTLEETRSAQVQEQAPEDAAPPEAEPPDLSFLSPEQDTYDPNQAAELLGRVIDQNVDQRTQAALAPLQEQLASFQLDQEAAALAQEFPELNDDEAIERVFADADKYAQQMKQPELAGSIPFARLVYMAGRAAELANEEQSPDVRTATLEGAGGAGAASSGGDRAEDALLAGARRSSLPFQ